MSKQNSNKKAVSTKRTQPPSQTRKATAVQVEEQKQFHEKRKLVVDTGFEIRDGKLKVTLEFGFRMVRVEEEDKNEAIRSGSCNRSNTGKA